LDFLNKSNWNLYIATNKRYTPTLRILQKKKMIHYFSAIMANEMGPNIILSKQQMISELKDKYSFSNGFMVGDTALDIEAGNSQNLKTIAVTYGYEKWGTFVKQNPTYIIDSFKEIINLVYY
jgi:phosphoglycolate phosphatase-like HAD superfamily hydrolase